MKKEMNNLLVKYRRRVVRRAVIKSVFIGLIIAFFAMFVAAAVVLVVDDAYFWTAFAVLGGVAVVSIPVLYFVKYRPSEKDIASALDSLGLEERAITMLELEGSRSYIANAQREDTVNAVSAVPASAIKAVTSTIVMVLLIVAIVLGAGLTTYTALASEDIVPGFDSDSESGASSLFDNTPIYTVTYEEYDESETYYVNGELVAVGDGVIYGDIVQMVREGEDCTTVYAEAGPDSVFVCWVDAEGNELDYSAERTDTGIGEDMEFYAVFVEYAIDEDGDPSDGDNDADEGDDSDSSDKENEEDEEEEEEEDNNDGSDGGGDDGNRGGESDKDSDTVTDGNGNNNYILDGKTDLFDEIESALDDFREMLNGDYDLTDAERAAINAYIDALLSAIG